MTKLRLLDLFSGIGGFSLGLERSGYFDTVAFCEIEDYPRRVLAKHWPEVPCYHDVKELTAERLAADGIGVDAICGGFPCQDISTAGKQAGIEAERSGLWSDFSRLIGELRPRVVFVENVANLISGPSEQPGAWFGKVLGDLAALGYDAEWHCIPASAVGAPHIRDRIWIVAYPCNQRPQNKRSRAFAAETEQPAARGDGRVDADAAIARLQGHRTTGKTAGPCREGHDATKICGLLPDANGQRPQGQGRAVQSISPAPRLYRQIYRAVHDSGWKPEPGVGRVANGVPHRAHRLKGLGNAVVPQIPEILGRAYGEAIL